MPMGGRGLDAAAASAWPGAALSPAGVVGRPGRSESGSDAGLTLAA